MIPKFRAWRIEEKVMTKIININFRKGEATTCSNTEYRGRRESLDKLILEQSTELRDKNGTEIFDGDLYKVDGSKTVRKVVDIVTFGIFMYTTGTIDKEIKVIGDIHKNPEQYRILEERQ